MQISGDTGALTRKAIQVFSRVLEQRSGKNFLTASGKPFIIRLNLKNNDLPAEGYNIEPDGDTVSITANDEQGLLYGLGKFLHTSNFNASEFIPGSFHGVSSPDKPFRAIYFATHFKNFYHSAPVDEVVEYIEELALWGYNGLMVWFDMHHYSSINDPKGREMQKRLAAFLKGGAAVGMKTGIVMLANEAYKTSPKNLRAVPITFTDHYKVEICPSRPGGTALILKQVEEELDAFMKLGVQIDRLTFWPYDQGGCGCDQCAPWGANGYLKITRKLAGMIRDKLPETEIILSTWLFDFREKEKGEWRGLTAAFKKEVPWVDYIMADSHTSFPSYPLEHPIPGDLPLINFPEISMWGNFPWGGYGANPQPERFEGLWNQVADKVSGGYPYSEGIFEDSNKVLYSQFYWNQDRSANDIMREYIAFEFSPAFVEEIMEAVRIMEKNYGMSTNKWARIPGAKARVELAQDDFGAEKAYRIMETVDQELPEYIRTSWRWRLLFLRAFLDKALRATDGKINASINEAFQELSDIQYLNKGHFYIRPPLNYGEQYPVKSVHE